MVKKILLYKREELGLFLFIDENETTQFVVGYLEDVDVPIGTNVKFWNSGTYYYNLEDAFNDIKNREI